VVRTYLGRAPVATTSADAVWLAVELGRPAHQRALNPLPDPPAVLAGLTGLRPVREIDVHGFRLILERAGTQARLAAARMPGAVLFPGPRVG
jgi:hypothetical protein